MAGLACAFAHGAHELGKPVTPSGEAGGGGLWKTKICNFSAYFTFLFLVQFFRFDAELQKGSLHCFWISSVTEANSLA